MMDQARIEKADRAIDLAAVGDFTLGGLTVRPARRQVSWGTDSIRELEPRVMQVLVSLASARPEVVSRDRLIEDGWNGRIVGDDAVNRCIVALRHLARDVSPEPFTIGTVPRVGYYLVEREAGPATADGGAKPIAGRGAILPIAALLAALLALVTLFLTAPARDAAAAPASLAVLPFRNLASGEPYFAEGVAEEILTQLSRQPDLKVVGRTSSWQFKDSDADVGEIGRRLRVGHVLEGSVRTAGDKVRVDVALVRTADGVRLWSQGFDGGLDNMFAIQNRIGAAVTEALTHRLGGARPPAGALATRGQVYSLYLTARGEIRARNFKAMRAARTRLRRAVALDPGFAPAWSSLAQAEHYIGQRPGPEGQALRRTAVAYARQALRLAPDFPEAHGVLGMLYGFDDPAGRTHIRRAVALDPNNAEFQFWLGHVSGNSGDFPAMLAAYRRAVAIDPFWAYAQQSAIAATWQMGHRDEAIGHVRRVEADGNRYDAHRARALLAATRGDPSEEVRQYGAAAAATDDPGKKSSARWQQAVTLWKLRLFDPAQRLYAELVPRDRAVGRFAPYLAVRQGKAPTLAEFRASNRNAPNFHEDETSTVIAARLLINAGRAADVVALYDDADGLLGVSRRAPAANESDLVALGPVLVSALRAVGRDAEAARILAAVERRIDADLRGSGGRAPFEFRAVASQVWALSGRRDAALAALEQLVRDGWIYLGDDVDDRSLADIGDEPAFRTLRGDPRFERVRATINGRIARERREATASLRA